MKQTSKSGYRPLDHVTDALIEAWAPTFEEALAQAGLGFFDTLVEVRNVKPVIDETLTVEGHDELELVYNWLERLLLSFEIDQRVFALFKIQHPIEQIGTGFRLSARAQGERYNPSIHGGKVEVKGVTYHLMRIQREPGMVKITYLLDL